MAKYREERWAISCEMHGGKRSLYVGQFMRRTDAIADHVGAIAGCSRSVSRALDAEQKAAWKDCQGRGDRAVRITIEWEE